eukprot:c23948_g1_i1.p1 GENE.c23948_g1_i1~~c23948_g1_i1.p1  ORF type:complete len:227 (+),score=47.78 c23948_g1_i1:29-709(+)
MDNQFDVAYQGITTNLNQRKHPRCSLACRLCCLTCLIVFVVVIAVLSYVLWPRSLGVCVDQSRTAAVRFSFDTDYTLQVEVALAIQNQNHWGITLERVQAVVDYHGYNVAQGEIKNSIHVSAQDTTNTWAVVGKTTGSTFPPKDAIAYWTQDCNDWWLTQKHWKANILVTVKPRSPLPTIKFTAHNVSFACPLPTPLNPTPSPSPTHYNPPKHPSSSNGLCEYLVQ